MVNLQSQEITVVGGRLVTNVIVPADELATFPVNCCNVVRLCRTPDCLTRAEIIYTNGSVMLLERQGFIILETKTISVTISIMFSVFA